MVFNWDLCGFAIGTFSMVLNRDLWWLFSRLERFLVGVFPRELYWCWVKLLVSLCILHCICIIYHDV
jgi:hypothetical protein